MQPTGELHLGTGSGRSASGSSCRTHPPEAFYSIVDYHALTIAMTAEQLRAWTLDMAATFPRAGSIERAVIPPVRHVPEHTELAWILTTSAAMGDLSRMTQFKEKSEQNKDNANAGIFVYPVLQAADILLYKADRVPVGEDQVQHLELARELARRFNRRVGADVFPEPQPLLSKVTRLKGLDGSAKMSKSKGNTVALGEAPDAIRA